MTNRHGFIAGSAAMALAAPFRVDAQALPHLLVGTVPTDAGMPPVFAQKTGIFHRNGVDVDVQFMNSGSAMASAVVGGGLNIGGTSVMGLIAAHLKGVPFQIIAPATVYVSAKAPEKLVVRKDSPIHTAADLNGKTIGSPSLSDLYAISTYAWVDQNGGDSKSLHEIEVPSAAAPAMLDAGRIDAAVLPEPLLSQTVNAGTTRVIGKPYDAIGLHFLVAGFFAMADFINANRDAVQRFSRSIDQANAFANAHPDQTAQWVADVTKVDAATIMRGNREIFDETLIVPNLQRVIDAAARYKAIDHAFDARDMISPVVLGLK
jgi:NitT/TauT family transport system substrate-binding protein